MNFSRSKRFSGSLLPSSRSPYSLKHTSCSSCGRYWRINQIFISLNHNNVVNPLQSGSLCGSLQYIPASHRHAVSLVDFVTNFFAWSAVGKERVLEMNISALYLTLNRQLLPCFSEIKRKLRGIHSDFPKLRTFLCDISLVKHDITVRSSKRLVWLMRDSCCSVWEMMLWLEIWICLSCVNHGWVELWIYPKKHLADYICCAN